MKFAKLIAGALSRAAGMAAARVAGRRMAGMLVIAVVCALATPGRAADQKSFATPEAAAQALLTALDKDDNNGLLDIFGSDYEQQLFSGDERQQHANRQQILQAAREGMELRADSETTRTIVIGKQAWPLPIPIVKDDKGWHFDTAAGIDEIVARRVGANELATIANLRAYVDAQTQYAGADRDGDDVLEYAQKITSEAGKKDGLYWEVAAGSDDELSPFGPFLADHAAYLGDRQSDDPFMGYYYRILTRQGENAPGGRYDDVINGNMIAGFGMVAFPAEYGNSGVMTFIVSQNGRVNQKDLGEKTEVGAAAIQEYNPDDSWTEVKE